MPSFTIETTYNLPVYRQRTYRADSLEQACRLALEDQDWSDQKEDNGTPGTVHVTGIWPGADTAYKAEAIAIPDAFADDSSSSYQPLSVPGNICQLPVMTGTDAESIGFAKFNRVPTLPIDIPDGGFTITTKTSEGRRVTFYFGPNRTGGPPRFIDVQYHDAGMTVPDGDGAPAPVFDMLTIAQGGRQPYDSRKAELSRKPSIAVILLDRPGDTD